MAAYEQREMICLRILGEDRLNFEDIQKKFPITPDKRLKKGDNVKYSSGKESKMKAQCDVILYDIEPKEGEALFDALRRRIAEFLPYKDYLAEIKEKYYISLRLSLMSDFAQMYYEIPSEILALMHELGINLEISILSFGEAIMEDASIWDKIGSKWRNLFRNYFLSKYSRRK